MGAEREGLADGQARVDTLGGKQPPTAAPQNDGPTNRPERTTGVGQEATAGHEESPGRDREHRSGYGGKKGAPDTSSNERE